MTRLFLTLALTLVPAAAFAQKALPPGSPADVGMSAPALQEAVALYQRAVADDDLRGAVLLVARQRRVVLHEAIGWRNVDRKLPLAKDTLFHVASNTKPVVATAILMLADEGKVDLDAEVRRYLPAFDNDKCKAITVRQLLTHTSGLRIPGIFLEPLGDAPSLQTEVNRFAAVGPMEKPGTTYSYNNPGYNTLGAIIEVVSKQPLDRFLAARIYQPLGMADTDHQDRPGRVERRSVVYQRKNDRWEITYRPGDPPRLPFVRASGGMITTAADYARFLQLYLDHGQADGRTLLKADSIRAATSPLTWSLYLPEQQKKLAAFYGLGWQVSLDGTFGHGGSDGTYAWVDPRRELIGIIFTQSPGGRNPRAEFMRLVARAVTDVPADNMEITPRLVAHRGLFKHAPENTLAAFGSSIDLQLGFELDVRRSKDGHLICVHDDDVKRTTDAAGKVADMTLADLKKLDAGGWFDPLFAGQRVPTLDEVLSLLKERQARQVLVALDLKIDDPTVEADVARLVARHSLTGQVVCIGRAITEAGVRRKLRAADAKIPVAVLVPGPADLAKTLEDRDADWVYVRFLPSAEEVALVHRQGKRVFLSGPLVAGLEPANWQKARQAGVDAILTDYPLDCRQVWRSPGKP